MNIEKRVLTKKEIKKIVKRIKRKDITIDITPVFTLKENLKNNEFIAIVRLTKAPMVE